MKTHTTRSLISILAILAGALGCESVPGPGTPTSPHGKLSELSRVEGAVVLCEHKVPAEVCTRHHPELVPNFKKVGDWCPPHGVPESQCFECHQDLTFEPLPKLPAGADVAWLSKAGEDVPDLDVHAVKGKVTVFDFYADWCAACRKIDGHLYKRIAGGDTRIAYRKLNIVEWESALARRYIADVPTLPYLVVYGLDGKRVTTLSGSDVGAVDKAIAEAGAR